MRQALALSTKESGMDGLMAFAANVVTVATGIAALYLFLRRRDPK